MCCVDQELLCINEGCNQGCNQIRICEFSKPSMLHNNDYACHYHLRTRTVWEEEYTTKFRLWLIKIGQHVTHSSATHGRLQHTNSRREFTNFFELYFVQGTERSPLHMYVPKRNQPANKHVSSSHSTTYDHPTMYKPKHNTNVNGAKAYTTAARLTHFPFRSTSNTRSTMFQLSRPS